jgi:hypothetical protein
MVNFVNNNITGGGKLFVTVVNVFGSWLGNFVPPGQTDPNDPAHQTSGSHNNSQSGSSVTTSQTQQNSSNSNSSSSTSTPDTINTNTVTNQNSSIGTSLLGFIKPPHVTGSVLGSSHFSDTVSSGGHNSVLTKTVISPKVGNKIVHINLAWLLLGPPIIGAISVMKKISWIVLLNRIRTTAFFMIVLFLTVYGRR